MFGKLLVALLGKINENNKSICKLFIILKFKVRWYTIECTLVLTKY